MPIDDACGRSRGPAIGDQPASTEFAWLACGADRLLRPEPVICDLSSHKGRHGLFRDEHQAPVRRTTTRHLVSRVWMPEMVAAPMSKVGVLTTTRHPVLGGWRLVH